MPALEFSEFIKRHGLQLLAVANTDVFPGAVVDKARRGYLPQGHLRAVLGGPPTGFWETEMSGANLVYGTTERTFSLAGQSSLSEMGVNVQGGLDSAKSATFSITGVYSRTFTNGEGHASMLALIPLIHELRKIDRTRWKLVNGKWIVTETYYATDAALTFETGRGGNVKADVAKAGGVQVSGGGTVTWKTRNSFTITKNDQVPFAFRGWKV